MSEATWGRQPGRNMNRKRSATSFDIAIDTDVRQKNDDGHDSIDLTPSHRIPEVLGSALTESASSTSAGGPQPFQLSTPAFRAIRIPTAPSVPKSSKQSTSAPEPASKEPSALVSESQISQKSSLAPEVESSKQSVLISGPQPSNLPTSSTGPFLKPELKAPNTDIQLDKPIDEGETIRKWDPKEYDRDVFDSDDKNMSLITMRKLAHGLSLLKEALEDYKKFNFYLGDIVSGPRHKGFLEAISATVTSIDSYTTRLRTLRDDKQRGNPDPSDMELIADELSHVFHSRRKYLWDLMEEEVDMTNKAERTLWVKEKKSVLGETMGKMLTCLEEMDNAKGKGWKEREVRIMKEGWERRWKAYGGMDTRDLMRAGWILDVGNWDS